MGSVNEADSALAEFVGQYLHDPLGFVQACYPWGKKGTSPNDTLILQDSATAAPCSVFL